MIHQCKTKKQRKESQKFKKQLMGQRSELRSIDSLPAMQNKTAETLDG